MKKIAILVLICSLLGIIIRIYDIVKSGNTIFSIYNIDLIILCIIVIFSLVLSLKLDPKK
ncbi:nitrogen fixation/metabolism regulation signal transduction histidine kinase [Lysinibacillus sp. TE18511]